MEFDFTKDPFLNLEHYIQEAGQRGIKDPNALTLSTVSSDGVPSSRIVLYKGLIRGGLSFFTNYQGRKSLEIEKNKNASFCFYWRELDLQIRVQGIVEKLTRAESEEYFNSRPRLSQLSAWASKQSTSLGNLQELDQALTDAETKFKDQAVPCPPHWGGFHLLPTEFEFWFGQQGRLHHRFVYTKKNISENTWSKSMRFP